MLGESKNLLTTEINTGDKYSITYSSNNLIYKNTNIEKDPSICANFNYTDNNEENNCINFTRYNPTNGKNDGGYSCYKRELCKNMAYSKMIDNSVKAHDKSNKEFTDVNTQYNLETINMINLITGIVGTFLIMFYV